MTRAVLENSAGDLVKPGYMTNTSIQWVSCIIENGFMNCIVKFSRDTGLHVETSTLSGDHTNYF